MPPLDVGQYREHDVSGSIDVGSDAEFHLMVSRTVCSRVRSRNVRQPDHILAKRIITDKAKRRPGSGEIRPAMTKHNGMQVDSILVDEAKFGEPLRQSRPSNFDLAVAFGLQRADR